MRKYLIVAFLLAGLILLLSSVLPQDRSENLQAAGSSARLVSVERLPEVDGEMCLPEASANLIAALQPEPFPRQTLALAIAVIDHNSEFAQAYA